MEITVEAPEIRFGFGQPVSSCHGEGASAVCDLSVPLLAGLGDEQLIRGGDADWLERHGAFQILRNSEGGVIGGVAVAPCAGAAETVAHRLYSELLGIADEQALYRIWNFVPGINSEVEGIEQYQSFNVGRCRAFREGFGESGMEDRLPAASAVGIDEPVMSIAFLAGNDPVCYFENPWQVPAYRYPEQYGPCSPSFARGSVVTAADGRRTGYLSGTASICGHETVGVGDLSQQFDTTVENIRAMLERMDFTGALDGSGTAEATFRIYVRHQGDLDAVRERFFEWAGAETESRTTYLRADICRSPLLIEIEGIFSERWSGASDGTGLD